MKMKLGEILVRAGVIDESQLMAALGEQKSWGHRLGVTLVKMGFVTEYELINGLANQLNLPMARLEGKRILPEVLSLVSPEFAEKSMCLPLFVKKDGTTESLFLGMDDPSNLQVLDDVAFSTGMEVQPVLVGSSELCQGIDYFYRGVAEQPKAATEAESPVSKASGSNLEVATEGQRRVAPVAAEASPPPEESTAIGELVLDDCAEAVVREELLLEDESFDKRGERSIESKVQSRPDKAGYDLDTRKILHVLTQLLIDNGVVDRVELAERLAFSLDDEPDQAE